MTSNTSRTSVNLELLEIKQQIYNLRNPLIVLLRAILGREPRPLRQYFYELASRELAVPSSL
jgi:hypothetical protein